MNKNKENIVSKKKLTEYAKVISSVEWATKLLKDLDDTENLQHIENITKQYRKLIVDTMKEQDISKVTLYPTRNSSITYTIE